jgi:hypothetical protein
VTSRAFHQVPTRIDAIPRVVKVVLVQPPQGRPFSGLVLNVFRVQHAEEGDEQFVTWTKRALDWTAAHAGTWFAAVGDLSKLTARARGDLLRSFGQQGISFHALERGARLDDGQLVEWVEKLLAPSLDPVNASTGVGGLSAEGAHPSSTPPGPADKTDRDRTAGGEGGDANDFDDPPLRLSDAAYREWKRRLAMDPDRRGD